ncbi:ATP-binding cassette, subfamily B, bacterial IrtB/YbtQ [Frankia sp. AiPs1]|uniref:ABC transporter ATP-binding protein n=1 Tax=Frankia sp. AiPa1 TaxID=573492 RepID=UPI00202AD7E7|nr:ABC transporter ATP-binding protein [Frankia sp. AiPa1]MCL9761633.1 ABC transporter ATP-binding protein/permease [Frankia sp. AiPa1]
MRGPLHGLVPTTQRAPLVRYLTAISGYAVSEGVAFGVLAPLLTALLRGHTATAARWVIPLAAAAVVGWWAHYYLGSRSLRLSTAWRRDLYTRIGDTLLTLPLGWYDAPGARAVPQLVTADVARVASTVFLAQALLGAILTPATVAVFLFACDWRIGLASLAAIPVVLLALTLGRRLSARAEAAEHAATTEAGARLVEFAGAQPTLRAAGQSAAGRAELDRALATQHRTARRQVIASLPGEYLGELGLQLAFTALLFTGVALATHDQLGPARMIALVVLGISMLRPLDALVGLGAALRGIQSSAARIEGLLTVAPLPEPSPHPGGTGLADGRLAGVGTGLGLGDVGSGLADVGAGLGDVGREAAGIGVELEDVRFAYPDGPEILRGLSLSIPAGRTTALVGASGSGKTTVTRLIARFHDVGAGTVRVGGVDVRDLASGELLRHLAFVFQDVYLFDGTVEDNIRFGNPDATDEQVREAARRARVDAVVARLPDGWASRVGEGGRLLSGGERQRVAIARALCRDAPIVLLDEATASLDPENEAAVHAALAELATARTVLVIAHRLNTVVRADQIAVLADGRVVERGSHAELLARDGHYAAFWRDRDRAAGWRLASAARPDRADRPARAGG